MSKHKRARPIWKGGPHDPSVIRGELGSRFLAALLADFAQKGARTIHRLRRERHQDYIKLIVALLPKEIRLREIDIPEMPDDEFDEMFEALKTVAKMKGMDVDAIVQEAEIKAIADRTDIAESQ